ncbi:MAG: STAS/SEC14 domain-containing protein [Anaerolineales bacterium]|nr:STAS/SEC14 domain-containing protein [Anaerolineales bacterium]
MTDPKPLFFEPDPAVGFTAERREDGGMNLIFKDITHDTLEHWHKFAEDHLLGSDRLVRNLYDLRQVDRISEEAIRMAVELNSDPSTRNIRLAVVVSNENMHQAIQKVADLTPAGGTRMAIFSTLEEAEAWLSRPMESMV